MSTNIEWRQDINAKVWDEALASLGGHPLQSALWGDARRTVDGIIDHKWAAFENGAPVCMARIEERPLSRLGWVGWVPKGPVGISAAADGILIEPVRALAVRGMKLLIASPWAVDDRLPGTRASTNKTFWVDLSGGLDAAWENLDRPWRRKVRRAAKLGVTIIPTRDPAWVERFYHLCEQISRRKKFVLSTSTKLMLALLEASDQNPSVEAALLLAVRDDVLCAGAFVARSGRSAHYLWGAADRATTALYGGEAIQWAAVEWACAKGCTLYDLEGVNRDRNPGIYNFKRKMGGREVTLCAKQYLPTGILGRGLALLDSLRA